MVRLHTIHCHPLINANSFLTGNDKQVNLDNARTEVLKAAQDGAKIVVLPECFNSPYGTQHFPSYAETLLPSPPTAQQSPSFHALSALAKEAAIYLISGSIPEADPANTSAEAGNGNTFYNTSLIFGPDGSLLDSHRKVHLFDIDIPGKIKFKESEVLTAGDKVTLVDTEYGKIAIAICYDIRFPELAMIAARKGAFCLIYPGAFNLTTGALHWELLGRARAADNQCYVALCSPARDMTAGYHAWGHSMIIDPWAKVLCEADINQETVSADLTPEPIEEVRKNIPVGTQRRWEVYPDVSKDIKV